MKRIVILIITICIVLSLFVFLRHTNFHEVWASVNALGARFLVLLLVTFLAYYAAALSWKYCLAEQSDTLPGTKLFLIRHIGETVGLFNPASVIGGDALKTMMLRKQQIGQKQAVVSVLSSRIILILTQLVLFGVALASMRTGASGDLIASPKITYLVCLPLFVGLLIVLLCWVFKKLNGTPLRRWPGKQIQEKTVRLRQELDKIREAISEMMQKHRKFLFAAVFFGVLHWIFGSLEFYFILKFMGLKVSVFQAILVDMGVIFFKSAGAFIPGQLGVEEYGNKIMLLAIGIPGTEIWVTASILRRARQMFWVMFGALVYLFFFKKRRAAFTP